MRALVIMRDADGEPQTIGEFIWKEDRVVTTEKRIDGAHTIMSDLRLEIDDSSSGAARASMERLALRYSGGYLWVKFEPGIGAGGRESKKMSGAISLSIIGEALSSLLEKQRALNSGNCTDRIETDD